MITKILKTINFILTIILVIYALKIYSINQEIKELEKKGEVTCFKIFMETPLEAVICSTKILSGIWKF